MANTDNIMPAKLILDKFSLKIIEPIKPDNITILILLSPKIIELSILLFSSASIKKYNDPKLASPKIIPEIISENVNFNDLLKFMSNSEVIPRINAVRNTNDEKSKAILSVIKYS